MDVVDAKSLNLKKVKEQLPLDFDKALLRWFHYQQPADRPVTGPRIQG